MIFDVYGARVEVEFAIVGEVRRYPGDDRKWARTVRVNGADYDVGVEPGRRVRIPFKPRGPKGYGFEWNGWVLEKSTGRFLWSGKVGGSLGAKGLVREAILAGAIKVKLPEPPPTS